MLDRTQFKLRFKKSGVEYIKIDLARLIRPNSTRALLYIKVISP